MRRRIPHFDALDTFEPLFLVSDEAELVLQGNQDDDRVFDSANSAIFFHFFGWDLVRDVFGIEIFEIMIFDIFGFFGFVFFLGDNFWFC